ncbi:hypothetical protein [Mesorhizobium huakuii]|uniref:Uncharacterized protein n=1 Tax=Mesorhizobium huakuii TaxID=28104 RepID=A0A7G6SMD0_9HYPH|nr:hypothetical protein [Mesorhizobium huakuii]QND55662.1 hypothetical protein HB778_02470 [Mesorhizobium huakuii]
MTHTPTAELKKEFKAAYEKAIEELSWLTGAEFDLVRNTVRDTYKVHASTIKAAVNRLRNARRAEKERAAARPAASP